MSTIWQSKNIDLVYSSIIAIFFPILAQFLYNLTGALIPMLLYYGLAWGMRKWRCGSTGYFNKIENKYPKSFFLNIGITGLGLVFAYFGRIISNLMINSDILLTAFIWAPINAASEQLLWIYIFESWSLKVEKSPENQKKRIIYQIIGLILFSVFVGAIHSLFWMNFLHTVDSTIIYGALFVLITTVTAYFHLIVWNKSNNMFYIFIPHIMLNFIPIFWTNYSMISYLFI